MDDIYFEGRLYFPNEVYYYDRLNPDQKLAGKILFFKRVADLHEDGNQKKIVNYFTLEFEGLCFRDSENFATLGALKNLRDSYVQGKIQQKTVSTLGKH